VADIDDPLQFGHTLEEIQHRVIRPIDVNGERHFAVKLAVVDGQGCVPADIDPGSRGRVMQQLDKLIGILIFRHDPLLDLQLLLQDRHFAVFFRQLRLKLPQAIIFRLLVVEPGLQLLVRLVQRIEVNVVVSSPDHGRGHEQHPGPRAERHFTEFRHINPRLLNAAHDAFCTFPVKVGASSQFSSNLNACPSFTWASCSVSLISTVLNAPDFLRLAIRSATALGLRAVPVNVSVLPSFVKVSSQMASVLLIVSATMFSRLTGPDCAPLSSSITLTLPSYMSAFLLLDSYSPLSPRRR